MRFRRAILAAVIGSLPSIAPLPARAQDDTSIAVVVLGPDADVSLLGSLQRDVEAGVDAQPGISVVQAASLAAKLGGTERAQPTDPRVKEATALIDQAVKSYYDDNAGAALETLGKAYALHESLRDSRVATPERVRLHLWRAAVYLAQGEAASAGIAAREVLVLDPSHEVNLALFPPPVAEVVQRARKEGGLRRISLRVTGLPPGAKTWIDDRPAPGALPVYAGRHFVRATAPGYRELHKAVDVDASRPVAEVALAMPVALPPELEQRLVDAASGSSAPRPVDRAALDDLAQRLAVDAVAVLHVRGPVATGLLWTRKGWQRSTMDAAVAPMSSWIEKRLPAAFRPPVVDIADRGYELSTDAGLGMVAWTRTISGLDGGQTLAGTGPSLRFRARRGTLIAEVDLALIDFSLSEIRAAREDGSTVDTRGGGLLRARAGAGWRHRFGRREDRPAVHARLDALAERYRSVEVRTADGNVLPAFTSHERLGAGLAAGGTWPLSARLIASGGLGVALTSFREMPSGMTGRAPPAVVAPNWSAGIASATDGRWAYGLEYAGELRAVGFSGPSRIGYRDELRDAQLVETLHVFTASARYSF